MKTIEDQSRSSAEWQAIRIVYKTMSADYGEKFLQQFNTSGYSPKDWADRFHKRAYGCSAEEIINGFDAISTQATANRMPSMDEIIQAIRAEKRKSAEIESIQAKEPPIDTGSLGGFVDELAKRNQNNPVAMREIAKMRDILARPRAQAEEERTQRLTIAVAEHEALLIDAAESERIKMQIRSKTTCGFPGCPEPATISGAINGGGAWYCMDHFRQRA